MPATPDDIFARLDELGVPHRTHHHAAAFTVEQGNEVWGEIPGVHCKNLFLKDAKARLWLVVAPAERVIDLKSLPKRIGAARLSFGQPPLLLEVLGVTPGSVTPFALINDAARRVTPVLDGWMMEQPLVNYHPLVNTATTTVAPDGLTAFIRSCGHDPMIVDFSD